MAITPTQRAAALDIVFKRYGNDQLLDKLLPGLTTRSLVQFLLNDIGSGLDAQLTTILNNAKQQAQSVVAIAQANVDDWTVT